MVREKNANIDRAARIDIDAWWVLFDDNGYRDRIPFISMIPAKQLLKELVTSLREVIAPAVAEPYAKSQAYMAAVVLEFIARQIEERSDIDRNKHAAMLELMRDLARIPGLDGLLRGDHLSEAVLCDFIGHLYSERGRLGEETFAAANQRVRRTLRQLLDEDLKVVGKAGE